MTRLGRIALLAVSLTAIAPDPATTFALLYEEIAVAA